MHFPEEIDGWVDRLAGLTYHCAEVAYIVALGVSFERDADVVGARRSFLRPAGCNRDILGYKNYKKSIKNR